MSPALFKYFASEDAGIFYMVSHFLSKLIQAAFVFIASVPLDRLGLSTTVEAPLITAVVQLRKMTTSPRHPILRPMSHPHPLLPLLPLLLLPTATPHPQNSRTLPARPTHLLRLLLSLQPPTLPMSPPTRSSLSTSRRLLSTRPSISRPPSLIRTPLPAQLLSQKATQFRLHNMDQSKRRMPMLPAETSMSSASSWFVLDP